MLDACELDLLRNLGVLQCVYGVRVVGRLRFSDLTKSTRVFEIILSRMLPSERRVFDANVRKMCEFVGCIHAVWCFVHSVDGAGHRPRLGTNITGSE